MVDRILFALIQAIEYSLCAPFLVGIAMIVPALGLRRELDGEHGFSLILVTAIGLLFSVFISGLIFIPPGVYCGKWDDPCAVGWSTYDPLILAFAGGSCGFLQWLVIKKSVRSSGWVILLGSFTGSIVGFVQGPAKDRLLLQGSHGSNANYEVAAIAAIMNLPWTMLILVIAAAIMTMVLRKQIARQGIAAVAVEQSIDGGNDRVI